MHAESKELEIQKKLDGGKAGSVGGNKTPEAVLPSFSDDQHVEYKVETPKPDSGNNLLPEVEVKEEGKKEEISEAKKEQTELPQIPNDPPQTDQKKPDSSLTSILENSQGIGSKPISPEPPITKNIVLDPPKVKDENDMEASLDTIKAPIPVTKAQTNNQEMEDTYGMSKHN